MKTKLSDNREVAHYWANNAQPEGRGSNFFFRDGRLYSYGAHFCIARILPIAGRRVAVFNPNKYSVSTSKQQGYARSAWNGEIVWAEKPDGTASQNRESAQREIVSALAAAEPAPRKRKSVMDGHRAHAAFVAQRFNDYLAALPESERTREVIARRKDGKPRTKRTRFGTENVFVREAVLPFDMSTLGAYLEQAKAAELKRQEDARKAERDRLKRMAALVAKWEAGEQIPHFHYRDPDSGSVLLRIVGEEVETSLGARAPLDHVRRVLRFVDKLRATPEGQTASDIDVSSHGHANVVLGHYTLDRISKDGVHAGCHFFSWQQIDKLRAALQRQGAA